MLNPATILKKTFGYESFRPLQRDVIENVLARRDTLSVMPTGGGKSLCYQIPAMIFGGLTVVVSPLISLMQNQVDQLRACGVPALFLNSSLPAPAYRQNMDLVRQGRVKLLYVAPESLMSPRITDLLAHVRVDLLTIDEAHCISEWGHDFRPEYRQLADMRARFPHAVCLALTATATARVREDIRATLRFSTANEFVASFDRPNLFIEVLPKRDPFEQTVRLLKSCSDQSGIIYCFSRRQVDDLASRLAAGGYAVRPYHAGLDDEERRKNQDAFVRDDVQIIVATIAFGMGIDKPNVRFVIHFDLPKSIEGYYQEIGRAGRDGLPSRCTLLYSYSDVAKINYFINQKEGGEKRRAREHLEAVVRYAEERQTCRRRPLLAYFGETYPAAACDNCDNCTSAPALLVDATIPAQKFLSCVKRAGEKFGAAHIVDILLGAQNEKVRRWGHDSLSTYGIGTELTRAQWLHLARQLLARGFLEQDGTYRTLRLTPQAVETLRTRAPVTTVMPPAKKTPKKASGKREPPKGDQALFALLRQKRKQLADKKGVPPYLIFPDSTLIEMAARCPQTTAALLEISGVGQVKSARYGRAFLKVIKNYCA